MQMPALQPVLRLSGLDGLNRSDLIFFALSSDRAIDNIVRAFFKLGSSGRIVFFCHGVLETLDSATEITSERAQSLGTKKQDNDHQKYYMNKTYFNMSHVGRTPQFK